MSTLSFESFWSWLLRHANCIARAGTADAVIFDDEDLHWHFAADQSSLWVQVIRGKRLMGELLIDSERVAYVQEVGGEEEDEHVFELMSESESDRSADYFFVMTHGFDEEEELPAHERAVH